MSSLETSTFTQITDPSARTRMTARSCEVSGQCSVCYDLFTVSVYLVRGQPAIADAPRLKWLKDDEGRMQLIHRPELCNGKVTLYGSLEKLSLPQATHYVVPKSGAKATHQRRLASTRPGTLQTNHG